MIKDLLLQLRHRFLRARLKAANRIFENLPFEDIEKRYEGRAANLQVESWRTVSFERGQVYDFYDTIEGEQRKKIAVEPSRRVFLANRGHVYSAKGVVYNIHYNCAVLETVETWGNDVNFSTEYLQITKAPSITLSGLCFSLLSLGAISNYAHFIFDSVSKLALLRGLTLEPDWFLVSGPQAAWKEKILRYLGLDKKKLVWVGEKDELSCEQLVFTSRLNSSRHVTPFAARAVRQLFLSPTQGQKVNGKRIIYASRKSAAFRKTPVEDLLQKHLPEIVDIVEFESLSMEDTIRLCQECGIFVGIHGAAFTNIVFCNPGIKVVELRIEEILHEHNRNYYQTLTDYLQCEHIIYNVKENIGEEDLKDLLKQALQYETILHEKH